MNIGSLLALKKLRSLWACFFILTIGGYLCSNASAQVQTYPLSSNGIRFITEVEGVREYQLDNGLRVLLFPEPSKPTITVNVTYLVGSRHERYGETGLAHLLEHLLFKGSKNHPNIPQEISEHGARANGTTSYDRTNYYQTFTANEENLTWALSLEADRMVNSFIAKKDLDSEMTVVRNEFEMGENSPMRVLNQQLLATVFHWHNYGKPTIGSRSDIENVPIETLQAFYKQYYQPDNAVLIISGQFNTDKTLALVAQYFAPLPRPDRALSQLYTEEPAQDGERQITVRRKADNQIINIAYRIPAARHSDFAALEILSEILGDTPNGRLHKALIETQKASGVFAGTYDLHDPGVMFIGAQLRQSQNADDVTAVLIQAIENIRKQPITEEEFKRSKQSILKSFDLALANPERIANELSNSMALGDWRLLFLGRDRIRSATKTDIQRVAQTYFKSMNRTIGQFIPTDKADRVAIPAATNLNEALAGYRGDTNVQLGEAFDPTPENIESRIKRIISPSQTIVAPKIVLLSKKTRGEIVQGRLVMHYGSVESLRNRKMAADLMGEMLFRGSQKFTRKQLQDQFDALKAEVSLSSNPGQVLIQFQTVRNSVLPLLNLITETIRTATFPENEFEELRITALAGVEAQQSEPTSVAQLALEQSLAVYHADDVRHIPDFSTQINQLKQISRDDLYGINHDQLSGQYSELALVGDFDAAAIEQARTSWFKDWQTTTPYVRVALPFQPTVAKQQSISLEDKANAVLLAGMNLSIQDTHIDFPALILANYIIGGGFLNSRLATRIRQQEGLSYSVDSFIAGSAFEPSGRFIMDAIAAPQNIGKTRTAMLEVLKKVIDEGFTETEVNAARKGLLEARRVSRAQDASLASRLATYLEIGRTMQWDMDLEKRIQSVTAKELQAAFIKYIHLDQLSIITAGSLPATK